MDSRIGPSSCAPGWATADPAFPKTSPPSLGGATAGIDFQLLHEIRKVNDTQKDVFFNKCAAL